MSLVLIAAIAACGDGADPDPPVELVPKGPPEPEVLVDRITVNVFRDPDADPATTRASDLAGWRISMSGRRFALDEASMRRFTEILTELGKARPEGEGPNTGLSARALIVRADGDAPYAIVQKVLDAAEVAGFHDIHVAKGTPRYLSRPESR